MINRKVMHLFKKRKQILKKAMINDNCCDSFRKAMF